MGSPVADGNPLKVAMPTTEHVANLKAVEAALIFSRVEGRRNWDELLRRVFREEYCDPKRLERVVRVSLQRIGRNYVPTKIMAMYREDQQLHARYALK